MCTHIYIYIYVPQITGPLLGNLLYPKPLPNTILIPKTHNTSRQPPSLPLPPASAKPPRMGRIGGGRGGAVGGNREGEGGREGGGRDSQRKGETPTLPPPIWNEVEGVGGANTLELLNEQRDLGDGGVRGGNAIGAHNARDNDRGNRGDRRENTIDVHNARYSSREDQEDRSDRFSLTSADNKNINLYSL